MIDYSSAKNFYSQNRYQECIDCCIQILSYHPSDVKTWQLCAFALYALGQIDKAIEYLEHSLSLYNDDNDKNDISLQISLGEMYRKAGNPEKAIAILSSCLPSQNPDLHFNLARALSDGKNHAQAIKHYHAVLAINPNDPLAWHNLGNQLLELKDYQKACIAFKKSFEMGNENAGINLAGVYSALFEEKQALGIYESLWVKHSSDPYFCFNTANTLWATLDFDGAKDLYQKAISLLPDPIFYVNYAYLLLSLGEFEAGFRHYQKRLLLPNILPLPIDTALICEDFCDKNVLVYHEQGFGDSLMFARFLDMLTPQVKSLSIYPQKPLHKVFEQQWGKCVKQKQADIPSYERAFSLLSLPAMLGVRAVGLNRLERCCQKPKNIKKIGLFFSSNRDFVYFAEKSIPPKLLLKSLKGFDLYSLQPEGIDEGLCKQFGVKDLSHKIKNFDDTLTELKTLDLLVSVDSAIVHLAGMYQIPTIVLLHKKYDWRWGRLGQVYPIKSPWYDSITGIAQERAGDWASVLEILREYLKNV
ncbi:tetratricopeptide repeat protein [Helicobacter sp. 11S02596-1]|uniref:tetratricopeptide repeat protein n=1 Tax=Helicobacter sp. 11S02596-1 TaxID=1476194 RepID=UPI000BA76354|nr:tetratricopeptide repeat protein [Helicobacter sp. 11S02596-1]PAF43221.1 hypothetical protein BJI48_05615 [Helicobacter sp. 11S02596-1]